MEKIRKNLFSLLIIAIMSVAVFGGVTEEAKAATTLKYMTNITSPGNDTYYPTNAADTKSMSLRRGSKLNLEGWDLANVQPGYYKVRFSYDGKLFKEVGATPFNYNFSGLSGMPELISRSGYKTKNSGYRLSNFDTSWMCAGKWTVQVYASRSDIGGEYEVAKITLNITATSVSTQNWVACVGAPKNSVGPYALNCTTISAGTFKYGTKSFPTDGWFLYDKGVKEYQYTIAGTNKKNIALSKYHRADLMGASKDVQVGLNYWYTNTGFKGNIDISGLQAGQYTASIYGVGNDGKTYEFCKIKFNIDATVTFNPNGGSGGNKAYGATVQNGYKVKVPAQTRSGYVLRGYATTSSATEAIYVPNQTYIFKTNSTLYAVWGFCITYDYGDGKTKETQIVTPLNSYVVQTTSFHKDGYILAGFTDTKGSNKVTYRIGRPSPTLAYSAKTLYAVWLKKNGNSMDWKSVGITEEMIKEDIYSRSKYEFTADVDWSEVDYALELFTDSNWKGIKSKIEKLVNRNEQLQAEKARLEAAGKKYPDDEVVDWQKRFDALYAEYRETLENEVFTPMGMLGYATGTQLGIEPVSIKVTSFTGDSSNRVGEYDPESGNLWVSDNAALYLYPENIIDTVAHELRHAYQDQRSKKLENYMDYLYLRNSGANYINEKVDENKYRSQILEAEAYAYGNQYSSRFLLLTKTSHTPNGSSPLKIQYFSR